MQASSPARALRKPSSYILLDLDSISPTAPGRLLKDFAERVGVLAPKVEVDATTELITESPLHKPTLALSHEVQGRDMGLSIQEGLGLLSLKKPHSNLNYGMP